MIVLSDNDIVLKLAGCNLLNTFFEVLEVKHTEILITAPASFALPKQAKKKLSDKEAVKDVSKFVQGVGQLPLVNDVDLLGNIQQFEGMDGGESLLMVATYQNPDARLATGDKRCLKSLIENQTIPPLNQLFTGLAGRVYCLETAMLLLMNELGFEELNNKVVSRCVNDMVLNMAFGNGRSEENAIECLSSYSKDLLPLLAPIE